MTDEEPTGPSRAELGSQILAGWQRALRKVPNGPRHNRRLAARFGVPLSDIDHLRDTRNRLAHPDGKIPRAALERAAKTIQLMESRTLAIRNETVRKHRHIRDARPDKTSAPALDTRLRSGTFDSEIEVLPAPGIQLGLRERVLFFIVDHWKLLLGTGIAMILAVVLLANYGIVGLVALPFVVALALLLLWVLLYVGAFASLIYSIVLFAQQEYLKAFLFLWLFVILGAIAEFVRQAVLGD